MPLLAYFGVVGTVLIGLLFVAEARLGPPKSLSVSTNFYGLPAPYKAPSAPVLTVRDAPVPQIVAETTAKPSAAVAQAQATLGDSAPLKISVNKMPREKKTKKTAKPKQQNPGRNLFAETGGIFGKNHRVW